MLIEVENTTLRHGSTDLINKSHSSRDRRYLLKHSADRRYNHQMMTCTTYIIYKTSVSFKVQSTSQFVDVWFNPFDDRDIHFNAVLHSLWKQQTICIIVHGVRSRILLKYLWHDTYTCVLIKICYTIVTIVHCYYVLYAARFTIYHTCSGGVLIYLIIFIFINWLIPIDFRVNHPNPLVVKQ